MKYIRLLEQNIKNAIEADPSEKDSYRSEALMVSIHYLNYYITIKKFDTAAIYLDQASEHYDGDDYLYELYYRLALYDYYNNIGQYDQALAQLDYLLDKPETEDIMINQINQAKARIFFKTKRYSQALNIYKMIWPQKDSIHKSILAKQIELLQQDYNSGILLLEKEQIKRNTILSIMLFIALVTCIFVWFMFKLYRVRKKLKSDELEILKMNQEVSNVNMAKDKFLSNIKAAISVPLNKVVQDSLLLASQNGELGADDRKAISMEINSTSSELMQLINNILDLSRMEAGMMKFSIQESNLMLLLYEVVSEMELHGVNVSLNIDADNDRALAIDISKLRSVLHTLTSHDQTTQIEVVLEIVSDSNDLRISVHGSKLSLSDQSQDMIITNEINRMFIEYFKGSYTICHPDDIVITLPTVCDKE